MNNPNTCFILIDDQLTEGINFSKLNITHNARYKFAQVQPESNFSYIKKEFLQLAADNRHGFVIIIVSGCMQKLYGLAVTR